MNNGLKRALLLVFCIAQLGSIGCTTMESVQGSPEALAQKNIRAGDRVTLQYVNGHSDRVKLTDIGSESLTGIADDGRTIEVAYADLLSLDHKKVEVLKSASAAVGMVVLGAAVIGAAAAGTVLAIPDDH